VVLSETGSTLLYQLLLAWASAYHQQFAQVTLHPAATASGKGIAVASAGRVSIGASDAYLSSGNLVTNPDLLNIPLAISAQQVNYNVPDLPPGTPIKLDGMVLAKMYQGLIRSWKDPAIARLNPGVPLPALPVVPLHRAESSGDSSSSRAT
jgi:phosphate transport system substrate-binding protein